MYVNIIMWFIISLAKVLCFSALDNCVCFLISWTRHASIWLVTLTVMPAGTGSCLGLFVTALCLLAWHTVCHFPRACQAYGDCWLVNVVQSVHIQSSKLFKSLACDLPTSGFLMSRYCHNLSYIKPYSAEILSYKLFFTLKSS